MNLSLYRPGTDVIGDLVSTSIELDDIGSGQPSNSNFELARDWFDGLDNGLAEVFQHSTQSFVEHVVANCNEQRKDLNLNLFLNRNVNGIRIDATIIDKNDDDLKTISPNIDLDERLTDKYSDRNHSLSIDENSSPNNFSVLTATLLNTLPAPAGRWGCCWKSVGDRCGDRWYYRRFEDADIFLVSDGLGNGPEAAKASLEAARTIENFGDGPVLKLVEEIHRKLQSTRGAVGVIGRLKHDTNWLEYCSVGDVEAYFVTDGKPKKLLSLNGTLGYALPKLNARRLKIKNNSRLIVHTDGVNTTSEDLETETLHTLTPVTCAATLLQKFKDQNDDALVSVINPSYRDHGKCFPSNSPG